MRTSFFVPLLTLITLAISSPMNFKTKDELEKKEIGSPAKSHLDFDDVVSKKYPVSTPTEIYNVITMDLEIKERVKEAKINKNRLLRQKMILRRGIT